MPSEQIPLSEVRIRIANWLEEVDRRRGRSIESSPAGGASRGATIGWDLAPADLERLTFPKSWQTVRRSYAIGSHPAMNPVVLDAVLPRLAASVPESDRQEVVAWLFSGAIHPARGENEDYLPADHPHQVPFAHWEESHEGQKPWWEFSSILGAFHSMFPGSLASGLQMLERRVSDRTIHPMVLWRAWQALASCGGDLHVRTPNVFARIAARGGIPQEMLRPYLEDPNREIRLAVIRTLAIPVDSALWDASPVSLVDVPFVPHVPGTSRFIFGPIGAPPPIPRTRISVGAR